MSNLAKQNRSFWPKMVQDFFGTEIPFDWDEKFWFPEKSVEVPSTNVIENDQEFIATLLREEKVLLVQGSGFNWPKPDHFRIVFLPHLDDLREAIERMAKFLEKARRRFGTAV